MHVQFIDPYPFCSLEPALAPLVENARRLDAAITFVTQPGIAIMRQYLKSRGPGNGRLVVSVRFPTDLVELANLEEDYPGTVFLHTGYQKPREEKADRGQFHSKLVLIERDRTERCIIVGSHNWTENALQGYNVEAGVIIRCQESDPIVAEAREHIEACLRRSEAFDRKRLRFYQAVQRDLHRGVGPGGQESEDFPGFEASEALVLHAEDGTPDGLPSPVQLFIPLRDRFAHRLFVEAPRVLLYLCPAGSLIGKTPPTASPIEHEGAVTMQNVVQDAPVTARAANCRIGDLGAPRVELLPGGTVPSEMADADRQRQAPDDVSEKGLRRLPR